MAEYTAGPEARAAESWNRTLSRIPTVFGRLVYLAALWDASAGQYSHPALVSAAGAEEADRALRHIHHRVFSQWLAFGLEEQKLDLDEFLRTFEAPLGAFHYRRLAPPGAREVERTLYITDLETLFELLRIERGAAWQTPTA